MARDIQWPAETEPGEHDRGVDALKIAQLTGHFLVFIASLPLHAETGKGQRMPSFRFAADSSLEEAGFELVWGFSCQVVVLGLWPVLCSELEGPFFVPSPAIRFPERAEGVKGPKR